MKRETIIPLSQLDGCINTISGRKVNLLDPQADQISINDIARGLANNSHFGGHVPEFFSIAQHCLIVCDFLEETYAAEPKILMHGLLHDASEAYLGDMLKPLKVHLPEFQEIENRFQQVIMVKYKLCDSHKSLIKLADICAQKMEYDAFYRGKEIAYYDPYRSYELFMHRYYKYLHAWQKKYHVDQ